MCAIRADGSIALDITTYGTNGNGLRVLNNTEGYAIESHGNVLLEARNGELIKIYGLTVNVVSINSS
jgi:predicted house-cleaning NTP pyrophosphatase (Maf/HAM1 superfamily)